ncbi:hypothetical protein IWW36_001406 [Coemansia brasiliensis]|uniref:Chitin-binding type-2 domain-containing protein n=1 Tax=Coemansia brasiliensis TaxID=2650707 RepID=A0A9W8LZ30_9FUNG|nr:hypothetical protein IWW36_001406 [Coemansia brasiliensis]
MQFSTLTTALVLAMATVGLGAPAGDSNDICKGHTDKNTVGQPFAHPTVCNQFLTCGSDGKPYVGQCPGGTYYDIKLTTCTAAAKASSESMKLVGSGQLPTNSTLNIRQEPASGATRDGNQSAQQPAQQMSSIVGALLMVNGKQTLCETIMVTPRFGMVAASCLVFQDNDQLDETITYTIGLSNGPNTVYGNLNVDSVVPHPNYNPNTFENNVAIVMASPDSSNNVDFANSIADWQVDWTYYYFVHRSQTEGPDYMWNVPTITRTGGTDSIALNLDQCSASSSVYAANLDDFICSPLSITYYYDRSCSIPYGAVYIGHDDVIAPAAIYSHSAIYGRDGYCGDGKIIHYYTILRNYLKWAESVSGVSASVYHSDSPPGYTASNNAAFQMNSPGSPDDPSVNIYGQFFINSTNTLQPGSQPVVDKETGNVRSVLEPSQISNALETVQITETSTYLVTETFTEVTKEATTLVATENLSSAGIVTSTLVETVSITETQTTLVQVTNSIIATASATVVFTSNLLNPTASLIITPNFYTHTVTAHDTVTQTVTDGAADEDPLEIGKPVNNSPNTSTQTVTESVTITTTLDHAENPERVIQTSGGGNMEILVSTETVFSTISRDSKQTETQTVTETTTVTPDATVLTSMVTITDMHIYTATYTRPAVSSNPRPTGQEIQMPAHNPDSEKSSSRESENSPNKLVIDSIIPHPNYNDKTFENNIAIVMLKSNPAISFTNLIADWPADWHNYYFVQRSITDSVPYLWNQPTIMITNGTNSIVTNDNVCSAASPLYAANKENFICNIGAVTYYYDRKCNLPYGTVYGAYGENIAAAAIYSHSAISGTGGYCGDGSIINYYTIIRNYIAWANQVAGMQVSTFHSENAPGYTASSNAAFTMNPPSGEQPANFQLYGRFTTEAQSSNSQQAIRTPLEDPTSTIERELGSIESPVEVGVTDTVTETSTDVVSSTFISTVQSTEITTIATTDSVAETGTSTVVVTSTTEETISTTTTETSTVQVTQMVTATATAFTNQQNPTASLIITPQFYTQTETVQDTVTVTVSASNGADQPESPAESQPANEVVTETVTVTETETAENVADGGVDTVTVSADGVSPIIFTQTVYSFIDSGESDVVHTVTETTTETATSQVITSYLTLTSVQFSTITETVEPTNPSSLHEEPGIESTEDEPESSSGTDADEEDNSSPSSLIMGLIVALVLLLLLLAGLIYYLVLNNSAAQKYQNNSTGIHRLHKRQQQVTSGGYGNLDDSGVTSGGIGYSGDSEPQNLDSIKGGVLMKGNGLTTCQVALASQTFGFVAASCIDWVDGNMDPNASYGLALSNGYTGIGGNLQIDSIIPHPNYNDKTFENNIAIVMLKSNPAISFTNLIADWPADWHNYYFVQRSITDSVPYLWNQPTIMITNGTNSIVTNDNVCSAASPLYAANKENFICNIGAVTYYYDRKCNLPYGTVYGAYGENIAAAAIYSHSAISGTGGYCGDESIINYYTIIRNYIAWANQVAGMQVSTFHSENAPGYTASSNAAFTMNPPSGEQPANFQLYGRFTTEAQSSNSQQAIRTPLEDPTSTIERELGSIESPVEVGVTDTVTETSTDVVSSTFISTVQSTEITTIATTDSVAETGTSTVVVTSTTEETISTTTTETSTVQVTQMVTATATAFTNQQNPTASLIITPQFYTQTETVQDTVTVTVSASNGADQPESPAESQPANEVVTETVTVTETETAENVADGGVDTVTVSADGVSPIIFTQTVYSFIDSGESDVVHTVTETTTETATPQVITSYLTLTSVQFSTITETVEPTNPSSLHEEPGIESTEDEPESSSGTDADEEDNSSPSSLIMGLIVALVLLLLLLAGLIYYLCVYRKRKQREQQVGNGYYQEDSNGRVRRWVWSKMFARRSVYNPYPPEYKTVIG